MNRANRRRKPAEFLPKKLPSQARARHTFDAIVDACTWLLPRRGYVGTTTNHIADRAGVNIASLYEYFPGKDAIVAQVAERLVNRVLHRLGEAIPRVLSVPEDVAVRLWIQIIYETILHEKDIVTVFIREIHFRNEIEAIRALGPRLLQFSYGMQTQTNRPLREGFTAATMHLLNNLVGSTIMQVIHEPPEHVTLEQMLDELALRVEEWIRPRPSVAVPSAP